MVNEVLVSKANHIPTVKGMLAAGDRFVLAVGLDKGDRFEVVYQFEPLHDAASMKNLRLSVPKGESIPSISGVYLCAIFAENEILDHFDIDITDPALNFQRRFVRSKGSPEFALHKQAADAPKAPERLETQCGNACPAGVDVSRYVRLVGEGKYAEALAVNKQNIPFPGILGRVCFAPCWTACRQIKQGNQVNTRLLKRFAYDHAKYEEKVTAKPTGKRVAVVGSGPGGLAGAYYLAKMGHTVTIYEALPKAGGMMRTGIPLYRLPAKVLDEEIDMVKGLGVTIKLNAKVDSPDSLLAEGYDAVLVAVGAHQGMKMGIDGEDTTPGVVDCVTFLRDVALGQGAKVGNRVAVIGGGNAAVDAARTALRSGAKEVTMLYRRTRAEMPVTPQEVEDALKEGVKVEFLAAPKKVSSRNGAVVLENIRMKLGAPDASGRPRPEPIPGSDYSVELDCVIAAIGQRPIVPDTFAVSVGKGNVIVVDKATMATSKKGVFAAGDAVIGPASVVEAIATAKTAVSAIDKYLGGTGVIPVVEVKTEEPTARLNVIARRRAKSAKPATSPVIPMERRLASFEEVELGLTEQTAAAEGQRCWRCDLEA
jgi:NADPH-dependent glutamate synthase beta subunit-like oxidoreductase